MTSDKQIAMQAISDVLRNTPKAQRPAVAKKLMLQHTGLKIKGI